MVLNNHLHDAIFKPVHYRIFSVIRELNSTRDIIIVFHDPWFSQLSKAVLEHLEPPVVTTCSQSKILGIEGNAFDAIASWKGSRGRDFSKRHLESVQNVMKVTKNAYLTVFRCRRYTIIWPLPVPIQSQSALPAPAPQSMNTRHVTWPQFPAWSLRVWKYDMVARSQMRTSSSSPLGIYH